MNQAYTLKRYPAQLSLTTWMSFVGAAQSAIFTACVQRKPAAWAIGFNIDLLSTIYAVNFCSYSRLIYTQLIENFNTDIKSKAGSSLFGFTSLPSVKMHSRKRARVCHHVQPSNDYTSCLTRVFCAWRKALHGQVSLIPRIF